MCNGDTTIEPPFWRNNNRDIIGYGIDGDGAQHLCKGTKNARKIAEQSEQAPLARWGWQLGDTVESIFDV